MSIRLRLALCYGILFALILPVVTLLSYAIHMRSEYDNLDRTLVVSVGHFAAEAAIAGSDLHLIEGKTNLEIVLRVFSPGGLSQASSSDATNAPTLDPQSVLRSPGGPAYNLVARLLPPLTGGVTTPANSAFGLISTLTQRWRVYVQPVKEASGVSAYIEALTPLGRLDAANQEFQAILLVLGAVSFAAALLGSWAIAGSALRPIDRMTGTAHTIARSHDLSHRIDVPSHRDELGRLATTFNEMLESIETCYLTQQRFVSDASHELRAPLTAIQGNLELLHRHREMTEGEQEEALDEALKEANRLSRLVAHLLALARADAGSTLKRRPIDLDPIVLDAFREARHLSQGQTLSLSLFEPARVEGDEDRLKQLLLILLDNALKYTPANGQITLSLQRQAGEAVVTVHDTGVGIPPEDLPHVFERFYRADPARSHDPGGTGLGLPIARWIAQQHGGEVALESRPNQGTTATLHLPLCNCPSMLPN